MDPIEKKKELRRKAMKLPLSPGVYLMHDKSGQIIYIGKAKALKNRVSQYFGSEKNHDNKVRRMVSHVDWFEYISATASLRPWCWRAASSSRTSQVQYPIKG